MINIYESHICCQESVEELRKAHDISLYHEPDTWHRKQWEDRFILANLEYRGLLAPGRKGIGFAVGQEFLPAAFADRGVEVLATDLDFNEARSRGWVQTGQHTTSVDMLKRDWLSDEDFNKLISYRDVNMNDIPGDLLKQEYDFVWSTCSFEHLGSLYHGLRFVIKAMQCLKPGGIAVHTTEFNLSSNTDTQQNENSVIYRECDMESLAMWLKDAGHKMTNNFDVTMMEMDKRIDFLPHTQNPHIRLQIERYLATSYGLVIEAGGA